MQEKFNSIRCRRPDLVFGFNITDEDKHYALIVKDGTCDLQEGETRMPTAPW